jgi:uncharacterized protein
MPEAAAKQKKAESQFQIFVKPVGAACNLRCDYCYYLEKKALYPGIRGVRMSLEILESYIKQHMNAFPGTIINFSWHGGEPTLAGLDYFEDIVELQQKYKPAGSTITNNIQTNGTLIDDAWCGFLSKHGFSVGLSMDGPAEMHDTHRRTADGRPTHSQVLGSYRLMQRHRIPCDILCVVNAVNVRRPIEVYRFFKQIGAQYLGFIPLVEPAWDGKVSDRTPSPEAWGNFLCAIFDEWLGRDIGRVQVQIFEEVARKALGHQHALCIFREQCGDVPVIEHNGDFFSCDHFVHPAFHIGNIVQTPLVELFESPAQRQFGEAKSESLPGYCRKCEVLDMCHGGCPKDRIIDSPDGQAGLNYLCAGYRRFFNHSRRFAEQLAIQSRAQSQGANSVRHPGSYGRTTQKIGRNDPCPCGSGKKYKNCCLGK